jgi:dienelactone hydrolase
MSIAKQLALSLAAAVLAVAARAEVIDRNLPVISYVNFQSLDPARPLTVSAQLRVPAVDARERLAAVVIVHGSAGVDSRGKFYAEALNDTGIATLEIDPDRIGILGFSWGGVVTMLTATTPYTWRYTGGMLKFAAHAAHYPVCWVYNVVPGYAFREFTGSPLLVQAGELDTHDQPDTCQNLIQSQLASNPSLPFSVHVYRNATHAWDRLQPAMTVYDPFAYLGKGGNVEFVPSPGKAFQSRSAVVRFFRQALRVPQ